MAIEWDRPERIPAQDFRCWICDRDVSSNVGLEGADRRFEVGLGNTTTSFFVAVCPRCGVPTFVHRGGQDPAASVGEPVGDLPDDVGQLYAEARNALSHRAPSGSALLARKLLMHVAVSRGAAEGLSFKQYVDYLAAEGIVTVDMRAWVDEIRELGNDANHELVIVSREEAEELLTFVAMLLRVVYEYPAKGRRSSEARRNRDAG